MTLDTNECPGGYLISSPGSKDSDLIDGKSSSKVDAYKSSDEGSEKMEIFSTLNGRKELICQISPTRKLVEIKGLERIRTHLGNV